MRQFSIANLPVEVSGPLPTYQISDDGSEAYAILPGFSYSELDRYSNVTPWHLGKIAEWGRVLTMFDLDNTNKRLFMNFDQLPVKHPIPIVLSAMDYQIDSTLYDSTVLYRPLVYHVVLTHIGTTSFSSRQSIFSLPTKKLVAITNIRTVLVDSTTRSAVALPDWMREKFSKLIPKPWTEVKVTLSETPVNSYSCTHVVKWSEIDWLFHANNTSYLKYCMDAIAEAATGKHFKSIAGDIGKLKIKNIKMVHRGETKAGHLLNINVWEDGEPGTVSCIVRANNSLVYQMIAQFVVQSDSKL